MLKPTHEEASKANKVLSKGKKTLGLFSKKDTSASWEPPKYWVSPDKKEDTKRSNGGYGTRLANVYRRGTNDAGGKLV